MEAHEQFTYLEGYSGMHPAVYRYSTTTGLERFDLAAMSWEDVNDQFSFLQGWLDPVYLEDLPREVQQVERGELP